MFFYIDSAASVAAPPITAIAFSPDGKQLVAGSQTGVTVYDWPQLKAQRTIRAGLPQVHDLAFSPAGKSLLVAGGTPSESGGWRTFAWPPGEPVISEKRSITDDVVFQSAWIDDERLAVASTDGMLLVVNRAGERLRQFKGHSRHVLCVAALGDGKTLVSGGADASLRVWDIATGKLLRTLGNHTAAVRDLAVRPLREGLPMIASAGADKTVRLWQPTIGRMVRFARLPSAPLAVDFTPDGNQLLAACEDGHLRVIDPETVRILEDEAALDSWAYAVAASPDGKQAVIAGERGQLQAVNITPP